MKMKKQIKLDLNSDEISCIKKTVKIFTQIERLIEIHECDTFMCCNECAYDIVDLRRIIADLETFVGIDEI